MTRRRMLGCLWATGLVLAACPANGFEPPEARSGSFGVQLAKGGHEVSLVARGPHLAAIRAQGLTLRYKDKDEAITVRLPANDDPAAFGSQDLVVIGVKAHGVPAILPQRLWRSAMRLTGDVGARKLLAAEHVVRVALPEAELDVDTAEDLAKL